MQSRRHLWFRWSESLCQSLEDSYVESTRRHILAPGCLGCLGGEAHREKAAQCHKGIALSLFATIGKGTFKSVNINGICKLRVLQSPALFGNCYGFIKYAAHSLQCARSAPRDFQHFLLPNCNSSISSFLSPLTFERVDCGVANEKNNDSSVVMLRQI